MVIDKVMKKNITDVATINAHKINGVVVSDIGRMV